MLNVQLLKVIRLYGQFQVYLPYMNTLVLIPVTLTIPWAHWIITNYGSSYNNNNTFGLSTNDRLCSYWTHGILFISIPGSWNVPIYLMCYIWNSMKGTRSRIRWHIRWSRLQLNRRITSIFMSDGLKLSSLFTVCCRSYIRCIIAMAVSVCACTVCCHLSFFEIIIVSCQKLKFIQGFVVDFRYPNPLESIRFGVCQLRL